MAGKDHKNPCQYKYCCLFHNNHFRVKKLSRPGIQRCIYGAAKYL
jgi:predicted PP-loop superfamily ATPase